MVVSSSIAEVFSRAPESTVPANRPGALKSTHDISTNIVFQRMNLKKEGKHIKVVTHLPNKCGGENCEKTV